MAGLRCSSGLRRKNTTLQDCRSRKEWTRSSLISISIQHDVVLFLEANAIEAFYTAKLVFRVVLSENEGGIFRRRQFEHDAGLMMIDGAREAVVSLGVPTEVTWIPMFEAYFNI